MLPNLKALHDYKNEIDGIFQQYLMILTLHNIFILFFFNNYIKH